MSATDYAKSVTGTCLDTVHETLADHKNSLFKNIIFFVSHYLAHLNTKKSHDKATMSNTLLSSAEEAR